MSIASAIAIYFIVWWLCLFVVLPFGVRNAHEAGEAVEQGNEAGAPVRPLMRQKVLATTVLAIRGLRADLGPDDLWLDRLREHSLPEEHAVALRVVANSVAVNHLRL